MANHKKFRNHFGFISSLTGSKCTDLAKKLKKGYLIEELNAEYEDLLYEIENLKDCLIEARAISSEARYK